MISWAARSCISRRYRDLQLDRVDSLWVRHVSRQAFDPSFVWSRESALPHLVEDLAESSVLLAKDVAQADHVALAEHLSPSRGVESVYGGRVSSFSHRWELVEVPTKDKLDCASAEALSLRTEALT